MPVRKKIEVQEKIAVQARITQKLPNCMFRVELENGFKSLACLSGKMAINHIMVVEGDIVTVELCPYDLSRGRIIFRKKENARK